MRPLLTRRRLLGRLAGLVGGGSMTALLARNCPAANPQTPLAISCCDGSLAAMGAKDCWEAVRKIEADGVEATLGEDLSFPKLFHPSLKYSAATPSGIERLKTDLAAAGKTIPALLTHNRLAERPEFEVAWLIRAAQAAQAVGASSILLTLVAKKLSPEQFLQLLVDTFRRVIPATDSTGVCFALENLDQATHDPAFLETLFQRVGSPRLGITLDTGNFYAFGYPLSKVYSIVERLAPHTRHVHCKNVRYPADQREQARPEPWWKYAEYCCPLDEGDLDMRRIVTMFRRAGYRHDLCVENESLAKCPAAERPAVLTREIRYLRQCLTDQSVKPAN